MATNGCPVCTGLGRVLAFGVCSEPTPVLCPECAGLAITPASADDPQRLHAYSPREITAFLLGRPALPAGPREHDEAPSGSLSSGSAR